MTIALLDLPDELLICICEQLADSKPALRDLALTCLHVQAIAEPVLYSDVFFRKPSELAKLVAAFKASPRRSNSVHRLDIRCQFQESRRTSASSWKRLGIVLQTAKNLNDLTIESPYCNNGDWQAATRVNSWNTIMHSWLSPLLHSGKMARSTDRATADAINAIPHPHGMSEDMLPGLKRLTLHLNGVGREFWTVDGDYAFIFTHRTIEELHLSSINIPDNAMDSIEGCLGTPLKRLTLDEANVTTHGLHGVLSMPSALEYLYIGENHYSPRECAFPPGQDYNNLCSKSALALTDALRMQSHSLRTLIYRAKDAKRWIPLSSDEGPDFSDFTAWEKFFLTGDVGMMAAGICSISTTAPELRALTLDEYPFLDILEHGFDLETEPLQPISTIVDANPKLKNLEIVCARSRPDRVTERTGGRTAITLAGEFLRRKGVALRLIRPVSRQNCVPPYLYGEELAIDVLIYENNDLGFYEEGGRIGVVDVDSDSDWTDDTEHMELVDEDDWDEDWEDEMHWGAPL